MSNYKTTSKSLAKAGVFDILVTYPVKYLFNEPFHNNGKLAQIGIVATLVYLWRSSVREYYEKLKIPFTEWEIDPVYKNAFGGCLGNGFKYVLRSLPEKKMPTQIMKNALLGCFNGAAYELANDQKLKLDAIPDAAAPIIVETAEAFIESFINGDDRIIENILAGAEIGSLLIVAEEVIYKPIDHRIDVIFADG